MRNIEQKIEGDKLILTIDMSPSALVSAPLSSTGKSNLLASSGGYKPLAVSPMGWDVSLSLNVAVKKDR